MKVDLELRSGDSKGGGAPVSLDPVDHEQETKLFATWAMIVCLLVAYSSNNMLVYLRDGSAQIILRAATLR